MKNCIICGKEFEPYYALRNKQVTCGSKKCVTQRNIQYTKSYYAIEENNKRRKLHQRRHGTAYCRICGKKIERNHDLNFRVSNSTMHDECVINDVLETLKKGEKLSSAQVQRIYQRGYTIKELREGLNDE